MATDQHIFPSTAKARGKTAPAKFAHAVLRTQMEQFPSMLAWWKTVLEAESSFENPFLCFMTYDDEHHRLAIAAMPGLGERPMNVNGVDHIAFTYAGLADLVVTYERLKAEEILPSTAIHHGPTLSLYYLDPDRNQVELLIDVFKNVEEIQRALSSEHFEKNPIGTIFDMDELCERFHAGVPEAELIRPLTGPLPPPGAFADH